jgi:hypothetical protein
MNVVNTIAANDVITKVTIERKGALVKFDAKVFTDYFNFKSETKGNRTSSMRRIKPNKLRSWQMLNSIYRKYGPVSMQKKAYLATARNNQPLLHLD